MYRKYANTKQAQWLQTTNCYLGIHAACLFLLTGVGYRKRKIRASTPPGPFKRYRSARYALISISPGSLCIPNAQLYTGCISRAKCIHASQANQYASVEYVVMVSPGVGGAGPSASKQTVQAADDFVNTLTRGRGSNLAIFFSFISSNILKTITYTQTQFYTVVIQTQILHSNPCGENLREFCAVARANTEWPGLSHKVCVFFKFV